MRSKESLESGATGRGTVSRAAVRILVGCVRFYQAALSPLMPIGCKFHPSCSHYAIEAIERHGALRGLRLAATRLARCSPFTHGGFDPVPDPDPCSAPKVRA